jgi:hypothetical protein
LALLTASKFGLPDSLIKRAVELSKFWDADKIGQNMDPFVNGKDRPPNANDIHYATTILKETAGKG